ncbi:hypothetical protein G7043_22655 [Lentzea sp. NEAU-D13]|uniref:Uncharacterized protein n=1 Tax=Lentzea alba TaxID=2714351 RepID=A0A7C9VR43_9PSEU|nr:hypothetical protein [Lentzea alba]NGY61733.1 hypothetical protein [Lentzea alba]
MNIEDELRGALDVPAPPPTTTLDHVLKRGRRRVFARRAGAMLGVVAAVAGIGIGVTTLNHVALEHAPADRLNETPATVERTLDWPRVNTPARTPYGTWTPAASAPPPAGRPAAPIPLCNATDPKNGFGLSAEPLSAKSVDAWLDLVRRALPEMTIAPGHSNEFAIEFDVTDSGGTGGIRILAGRPIGTPQSNADDGLWAGDCEPARRLTRADGTIMQLHGVRPVEPFLTLKQVLQVYRKDGLYVQLELLNFGTPDLAPAPDQPGFIRTGPGRANLPLTEEQFARLGPIIAEVA